MLLGPLLALGLAAQFSNGNLVSSEGCVSLITGTQTTIVAARVATFRNNPERRPKQGELFRVSIDVHAFPQPCATHLVVRPGFKLPAGVEFVRGGDLTTPGASCRMGPANNLVPQPCMLVPTETLADGTMIFDHPNGLWQIPDGQVLRMEINVKGTPAQLTTLTGRVDFAAFDVARPPLLPTVPMEIYFNPPSITYPDPAVTDVGPYDAHVFGFVDPHFNAGTVRLELGAAGTTLAVVDEGFIDASLFAADVNLVVTDLAADTPYEFRWTYQVTGQAFISRGAIQTFRTLPVPRFAFTSEVSGSGSIETDLVLGARRRARSAWNH